MSCFTKLSLINNMGKINERIERRESLIVEVIIGKITLMLHSYCKATYKLGQIFSLKRHTIWDGWSISSFKFINICP